MTGIEPMKAKTRRTNSPSCAIAPDRVTNSSPLFPILADNTWTQLSTEGEFPGSLQEHTMVGYRDTLYIFGGEVGFSNGVETPLWMYSVSVRCC